MVLAGDRYSGEAINTFDLRDKDKTKGTYYWSDEWNQGAAMMIDGKKLDGFPLKFDLLAQTLEIQAGGDIKVLPVDLIKEFKISAKLGEYTPFRTYKFIRIDMHFSPEFDDPSFYVVVYEGKKLNVLLDYEIEVMKPNYVAILDAGSVNPTIVKKERYKFFDGDKLVEMPTKKKAMISLLTPYKSDVADFIKQEKISLKKWDDLVKLFTYCEN